MWINRERESHDQPVQVGGDGTYKGMGSQCLTWKIEQAGLGEKGNKA